MAMFHNVSQLCPMMHNSKSPRFALTSLYLVSPKKSPTADRNHVLLIVQQYAAAHRCVVPLSLLLLSPVDDRCWTRMVSRRREKRSRTKAFGGVRLRCAFLWTLVSQFWWAGADPALRLKGGPLVAHASHNETTLFSPEWEANWESRGVGCNMGRKRYVWRPCGFGSNVIRELTAICESTCFSRKCLSKSVLVVRCTLPFNMFDEKCLK